MSSIVWKGLAVSGCEASADIVDSINENFNLQLGQRASSHPEWAATRAAVGYHVTTKATAIAELVSRANAANYLCLLLVRKLPLHEPPSTHVVDAHSIHESQSLSMVFRPADRNVGGRQHLEVSAAAEAIVQPGDAEGSDHDAPKYSKQPGPNERADSSGQLQCNNGKFAYEYWIFFKYSWIYKNILLNIHEWIWIFMNQCEYLFEYSWM